jgi:glycosyltransferase involved in cell wall biosynthesis
MSIRSLHIVKTSDGAPWAAWLARELIKLGVEVHVALPSLTGTKVEEWRKAGAILHEAQLDLPVKKFWKRGDVFKSARRLVDSVKPDILHSHFVGTTLTLRYALGKNGSVPRIFQVPGPLHLEHRLYRQMEIASAGAADYWIASSRCIEDLLLTAGVDNSRVFMSYYGSPVQEHSQKRSGVLREKLGITPQQLVVGNISWVYRPKPFLGQKVGLKCHEDMIDALALVTSKRADVVGVLVGSGFTAADKKYAEGLQRRAQAVASGRVLMPGAMDHSIVKQAWPDFDCAIHVPLSENTGGVTEPMFAGVPTIASRVGGLPEVILDGITGKIVPPRRPGELADAILEVLANLQAYKEMALTGSRLTREMYDVGRTAEEVFQAYGNILNPELPRPVRFDSRQEVQAFMPVAS